MSFAAESRDPVRHHYVPRAYLAPFTHDGTTGRGHLWVYGRNVQQPPTREPLMEVAFEPHMYTVPDEDGVPSPVLERRLAREIERPFATWHRRVVKASRGNAPTVLDRMAQHERRAVARYILYQHLRTPAQRRLATVLAAVSFEFHTDSAQTRAAYRTLWDVLRLNRLPPLTPDGRELDFEAWFSAQVIRLRTVMDADTKRWLDPISRYAEPLIPILVNERAWRIVELPANVAREVPLITCDNPVVLARPRAEPALDCEPGWDVALGGGWNEPAVEATLTLSPRHALIIAPDASALAAADDPTRFAVSLRVRTARHALQHVYARAEDERIAALVRATRGPDVVFEVGAERLPGTVDAREVIRRIQFAGAAKMGVRFTDE